MDNKRFSGLWDSWQIGEILGKGTYGTVYKMSKTEFGKTYYAALKHISIPANEQEIDQLYIDGVATESTIKSYYEKVMLTLQDEIKTCYNLKGNTHIVSYEDHKIIPKKSGIGYDIYIKMELLGTLSEKIKRGVLPTEEVVKVGIDICRALETLAEQRIIHRDIKPSNLFISPNGKYKLGDFGVARQLNQVMSGLSIKGTLKYMPPEIFRGEKVDFTSDIYSLGLVMYSMLNDNRAPFAPPAPATLTYEDAERANSRRLKGEPLPKPVHADNMLSEIILNACAFLPQNRWKSATAFRTALEVYLEKRKNKAIPIIENKSAPPQSFTPPASIDRSMSTGGGAQPIDSSMSGSIRNQPQPVPVANNSVKKLNTILGIVLAALGTVLIGLGIAYINNL